MDKERDEKRERQRRLFLRYFDEFEASGLDPVAVMNLAFSINSGVFLRRAIEGMKLFQARCLPPIEFFWGLENADARTRGRILNFVNWTDPKESADEIKSFLSRRRREAEEIRSYRNSQSIKAVDELALVLPEIVSKFKTDGETPESLFGIPGEKIAAVLSAYLEKRRRERRRGGPSMREIAVAIRRGSAEDAKDVKDKLVAARKEKRRGPRPRRKQRRVRI